MEGFFLFSFSCEVYMFAINFLKKTFSREVLIPILGGITLLWYLNAMNFFGMIATPVFLDFAGK